MKRRLVHPAVKWGCLLPLITAVVLICGVLLLDRFIPSAARRKLPASATQIQEYYSNCWNGDFVRLIKAKLPRQEYAKYAGSLNLASLYDPAIRQDMEGTINMGIGDAPSWWNPPTASGTTYFEYKKGNDCLQVLSYSNGYVYYLVTSW